MAAWFLAPVPINLNSNLLKNQFKFIQVQSGTYLIGNIQLYNDEITAFVHSNGWVVAYFSTYIPSSFLLNDVNDQVTRLEKVLAIVAHGLQITTPAISFFNFRYPDSNRLLLIGRSRSTLGWNTFTLNYSLGYSFSEYSWYLLGGSTFHSSLSIDDLTIATAQPGTYLSGIIEPNNFVPAGPHIIGIYNEMTYFGDTYGGLALLYKDDLDTIRFNLQGEDFSRKIVLDTPPPGLITAAGDVPRVFHQYIPMALTPFLGPN